jgi:hypothetical protein
MKSALLSGMFLSPTSIEAKRETVSSRDDKQDLRFAFIAAAISVAVLLPIIIVGVPNGADLPNHLRFAEPFYEAIQSFSLFSWISIAALFLTHTLAKRFRRQTAKTARHDLLFPNPQ